MAVDNKQDEELLVLEVVLLFVFKDFVYFMRSRLLLRGSTTICLLFLFEFVKFICWVLVVILVSCWVLVVSWLICSAKEVLDDVAEDEDDEDDDEDEEEVVLLVNWLDADDIDNERIWLLIPISVEDEDDDEVAMLLIGIIGSSLHCSKSSLVVVSSDEDDEEEAEPESAVVIIGWFCSFNWVLLLFLLLLVISVVKSFIRFLFSVKLLLFVEIIEGVIGELFRKWDWFKIILFNWKGVCLFVTIGFSA